MDPEWKFRKGGRTARSVRYHYISLGYVSLPIELDLRVSSRNFSFLYFISVIAGDLYVSVVPLILRDLYAS